MPPRQPLLDRASSSSDSVYDGGDLEEEELLQLSSSDSSAGPSPVIPKLILDSGGDGVDQISKDLAELEELRKNVQKNLRLRPIRSRGRLPKMDVDEMGMKMPGAFPMSAKLKQEFDIQSPTTPMVASAITAAAGPALATALAHANETTSATMTDMDHDAIDGMSPQTTGDSPNASVSTSSTSATPTRLKPKPKSKTKAPPPALVLQDSTANASTHPSRTPNGTDDDLEGEIIIPPRPQYAKSTLGPDSVPLSINVDTPLSPTSPTSSIVSSYFTPIGDTPITSRFIGAYYSSPLSTISSELDNDNEEESSGTLTVSTPTEPSSSNVTSFATSPATTPDNFASTPQNKPASDKPQPIPAGDLYSRLSNGLAGQPRPLVIDTRAPAAHVAYRIRGSVNIAIPSLILKRCRKMTASGILRGGATESGPSPNVGSAGLQTGSGKGGFQNMESLRQFVVGEKAKEEWSMMLNSLHRVEESSGAKDLTWDGDVIVYDEEMEQGVAGTAWILMEVLVPLVARHGGRVDYLEGGIMKGVKDTEMEKMVEFGPMSSNPDEELPSPPGKKSAPGGLFQLDTKRKLPDIEASSSTSASLSSNPASPNPISIPRSPLSIIPPSLPSSSTSHNTSVPYTIDDSTAVATSIPVHVMSDSAHAIDSAPSPPPSSLVFRHLPAPGSSTTGGLKAKRPSVPNLRRIDTKSAERLNPNLPRLSVRTKPVRSATLTIPPRLTLPGSSLQPPASPSHLNLVYSSHSPPVSARYNGGFIGDGGNGSFGLTPYYTPPHTPGTPKAFSSIQGPTSAYPTSHGGSHSQFFGYSSNAGPSAETSSMERDRTLPPSPVTARPEPPSTESESIPTFTISTILPNFLYLGPELTEPVHVEELKELGVQRILNIAAEINEDDHGLRLKERFERYVKIPMRDTVEEENVLKGVRQACEILDDARLHSAPTYVHCKAGKSRSVTAVMAYLIHANHWTLSRAYSFVLERRKGISPNIGFVSELMNFEEQELGGKSIGVQSTSTGENGEGGHGPEEATFVNMGLRRGGHIRESLPPLESFSSAAAAAVNGDKSSDGNGNGGGSALGPMSAGGIQLQRVLVGDQAQEMEVKDANGRYRHARRAPVDETTLQPLRRVSKAGLESSVFEEVPRGKREREKGKEKEATVSRWT
ncbi:Dual specificity protein phosphatase 7 [Leucoagaricus sp. SymC.cos]|nr:Dual specificity protein phosphatase 7 [Leucoagaricus sp. SymC.cos]